MGRGGQKTDEKGQGYLLTMCVKGETRESGLGELGEQQGIKRRRGTESVDEQEGRAWRIGFCVNRRA